MKRSLVFVLLAACSGGKVATETPTARPADPDVVAPFGSPGRWAYFPREVGGIMNTLAVDPAKHEGATCLVVTNLGDRWLVRGKPDRPCAGIGRASASPVFGTLVSADVDSGNGFRFLSESGALYFAKEPLSPFTRASKPPKVLRKVSAGGKTVVGIDESGAVFTFDGEWKAVTVPSKARLFDVVADQKGRAVAVGVPESYFVSTDGAMTFRADPGTARVGAFATRRSDSGAAFVEGVLGSLALDDEGKLVPSREKASDSPLVEIELPRGPLSEALREGRADLSGDRYYDVRYGREPSEKWELVSGPLTGPFEPKPLGATFEDCAQLKLAAHRDRVALLCTKSGESASMSAEVFVSNDKGGTFTLVTTLEAANEAVELDLADNTLLVSNVCKVETEKSARKGRDRYCEPRGPIVVKLGEARATTLQTFAPQLDGGFSPVIGQEGRLFLLGRQKKDGRAAMFVAADGKNFEPRVIEAVDMVEVDDGEGNAEPVRDLEFLGEASRLTVDETGTVGLAMESMQGGGFSWVTFDSDGRVVGVSPAPEPGGILAGYGRRTVAVAFGNADGTLRAWESADGGAAWNQIAVTAAVGSIFSGDTAARCDGGGCVFGDTIARVGWDGQLETELDLSTDFPPPLDAALRPTIACELSPKNTWTTVKGFTTGALPYPRLSEVARGGSVWSLMSRDIETGALDVISASVREGSAPYPVSTKSLLGPLGIGKGKRVAWISKTQAEGYIAAKVTVPEQGGRLDAGKRIANVEIAWANFYLGIHGKRTVSDAGAWAPNVLTDIRAGESTFLPTLLTVTGKGVVFRAGVKDKAFFVDGGRKTSSFDYPNWSELGVTRPIPSDAAAAGDRFFPAVLADVGGSVQVFVLADKKATTWKADARTVSVGDDDDVDWSYLNGSSGVTVVTASADTGKAEGFATFLKSDGTFGERIAVPTLLDLQDKPRPCSAEDRKATPRAVSGMFGNRGTPRFRRGRHAIVVTDGAADPKALTTPDPTWFLSDGAVLHGTPKDPCLAGMRGSAVRRGAVVVLAGDLEHAWMFRQTGGLGRGANNVEYRAMTCKLKPDVQAPPEVEGFASSRSPEDPP